MKKISITKKKWYLMLAISNAIVLYMPYFITHYIVENTMINRIIAIIIYLVLEIIQFVVFVSCFEIEDL